MPSRPRTSIDVSRKLQSKGTIVMCPCEPIQERLTDIIKVKDNIPGSRWLN